MFKVVKLNFTVHGVRFFIERLHCWFQETEDASSISVDFISSDLILTSICFIFFVLTTNISWDQWFGVFLDPSHAIDRIVRYSTSSKILV